MNRPCLVCGKPLINYQSKYCSNQCTNVSQTSPIGTEVIKRKGGHLHIFVKIGIDYLGNWIMKKKSTMILEDLLGRALTRSEKLRVEFLDSNTLNVQVDNLYIRKVTEIRICQVCGTEFEYLFSDHNPGKFCGFSCRDKAKSNKILLQCLYCGKEVWRTNYAIQRNSMRVFCSLSHSAKHFHERRRGGAALHRP